MEHCRHDVKAVQWHGKEDAETHPVEESFERLTCCILCGEKMVRSIRWINTESDADIGLAYANFEGNPSMDTITQWVAKAERSRK